jgi:hypothetical protein
MKQKIILLLITLVINSFSYGQENNSQQDANIVQQQQLLLDLLRAGKYFEAKELHNELEKKQTLDIFVESYYKYKIAFYENKPESAVASLERLLTDFGRFNIAALPYYYDDLWGLYNSLQNYKKSIEASKRMRQQIRENPFNFDRDSLATWKIPVKNRIEHAKKWNNQKRIRVEKRGVPNYIKIDDEASITFDAKYNGKQFTTTFDTGVSFHFLIKKQTAIQMGLKKVKYKKQGYISINGVDMNGEEYIADSIEFADIKLYNIPVIVYDFDNITTVSDSVLNNPQKRQKIETLSKRTEVVMGLPAMLLLKRFIIDWNEKTIVFPLVEPERQLSHESNSFLFYNKLYTRTYLNGLPFTAFIDTGSDSYMDIDSLFYAEHKADIPLDSLSKKKPLNIGMLHTAKLNIPYEIPGDLNIKFNNITIEHLPEDTVQIYNLKTVWPAKNFDGTVGYKFIRSLGGKVLFDFENMRIEAIEGKKYRRYEEGTDCHHPVSQ